MKPAKNTYTPLGSFNFAKGFAMICIILRHSMNVYNTEEYAVLSFLDFLQEFIMAPIIPLFLLISGYGFKEKKTKAMLKNTFERLVIPYLWVALAFLVVCPVIHFLLTLSPVDAVFRGIRFAGAMLIGNSKERIVLGMYLPWWLPTWYLMTSFLAFNLLNLIVKLKKTSIQIAVVVLCVAVGYGLFLLEWGVFYIPHGLMATGYCYIGYLVKRYDLLERLVSCIWVYLVLIPVSVVYNMYGTFDMSVGTFGNVFLDYFGAGLSGFTLMLAGVWIGRLKTSAFDGIKQIGAYTNWIICLHTFEANAFLWESWSNLMVNHQLLAVMLEFLFKIAFMTAGCMILKKISKYRYTKKMAARLG